MKKVYSMMWMAMMAAFTMMLPACSDDDDEQMNTEEIVRNLADGMWYNADADGLDAIAFGNDKTVNYIKVTPLNKMVRKGTYEVTASNQLTATVDGEHYTSDYRLNGDELTTTNGGVTTTYRRTQVDKNLTVANKRYKAVDNVYSFIKYNDGKTKVPLPENLQVGNLKELNLAQMLSQFQAFGEQAFKEFSFTGDKVVMKFTLDGQQNALESDYTFTKGTYAGYNTNHLSLTLGFYGLRYSLNFLAYASPDHFCLVCHTDELVHLIANLYCNNAGVKYGKTFSDADVKQLESLVAGCIEEMMYIFLFVEQ